jgi:ribonuclease P/MRP protein subunit RPP40
VPSKFLFKLELYGITGNLLKWIRGFPTNRKQCVVIDRFCLPVAAVISGVPQGSVLGPILLIIYINDIDTVCCGETVLQLFADDAKLYSKVPLDKTSVSLQNSPDRLVQWASEWQLTMNVSKCLVLVVSNQPQPNQYFINGVAIPQRNDLSILV